MGNARAEPEGKKEGVPGWKSGLVIGVEVVDEMPVQGLTVPTSSRRHEEEQSGRLNQDPGANREPLLLLEEGCGLFRLLP